MRKRFVAYKSRQGTFYSTVRWGQNTFSDTDNAVLVPGTARAKSVCAASRNPSYEMRYMSILPKSAAWDVCEGSRNPNERDTRSRCPTVRAADAYPRNEAAWSVSACSMNQAVQEVHAYSKIEIARDTCVSSRNETDGWAPEMKLPKISACVPEWNRQRYLNVCQNETARDICVYEWNWRIYLDVCQNETARDICVYEWNWRIYLHVFQNETAENICMCSRMKSSEIPGCMPERNRQRYLRVRMKLTDIFGCMPEWNRQRYLRVFQKLNRRMSSRNETAKDICMCSRMKPSEISGCAPEKNQTDIPARVPGIKPRYIPPILKSGEVSVRVPVNKQGKNYNYAILLHVWPTQYSSWTV